MNFLSILTELLADSGFAALTWQSGVMILISFVLPAILSYVFCEILRKMGWIKEGDLKLA